MTKLIIVESPAKGKTIEGYLGRGYRVTASKGHIRDLPENRMGVSAPDYKPEYVFTDRGAEVISRIKRLASECDEIILASDLDREGESISWHLQQSLGLKQPKRLVFNEITKKALNAALENPQSINVKRVAAQEARRVVDRVIGYRTSPVLAEYLSDRSISAGRVQSIAVRLVVDLENEINSFKAVEHYSAKVGFGSWSATWDNSALIAKGEYWTDKDFASRAAAIREFEVVELAETESKSSPPAPFTTSSLQAAGSNTLGFSPKHTMELAQKLYEQGAISYMRTDSTNLSEDAIADIKAYCQSAKLPVLETPRTWGAKADAQEAHEAIRPAHIEVALAGETEDQQKLYQLIWLRTVSCQLEEARFTVRTVTLRATSDLDEKQITLVGRGKTLVHKGWKELTPVDTAQDPDKAAEAEAQDADNPIPYLESGSTLTASSGELVTSKTKAPGRYTEASLVTEMEKRGIGRPSTFGKIVEEVTQERSYLETFGKKKQLRPTHRGNRLVNALVGRFSFIEYNFTRILEEQLAAIEDGKTTYAKLVGLVSDRLGGELEKFKAEQGIEHPCPSCGRGLFKNEGKKKKDPAWWGCAGYLPENAGCNYTAADDDGKPGKPNKATAQA